MSDTAAGVRWTPHPDESYQPPPSPVGYKPRSDQLMPMVGSQKQTESTSATPEPSHKPEPPRAVQAGDVLALIRIRARSAKRIAELLHADIGKVGALLGQLHRDNLIHRTTDKRWKAAATRKAGARGENTGPTRADRIIEILEKAAAPMHLTEVYQALGGIEHCANSGKVAMTLHHLIKGSRIQRFGIKGHYRYGAAGRQYKIADQIYSIPDAADHAKHLRQLAEKQFLHPDVLDWFHDLAAELEKHAESAP